MQLNANSIINITQDNYGIVPIWAFWQQILSSMSTIMTHKKLENAKQKSYLYFIIFVYNISDVI